ncbi:MAG TPA: 4-hydroxyphenylacetate 3-hydroxylase N-terminal domain-containing protein [Dehalococcoidia bacterium]|nr:4-hydroxyphenylacetate 3-hydroxylase N-terminal domain-containing protein [Dehalococcoidia bacterium]
MAARTGQEYLAGLRDDREIWLNGERVKDVTAHPALAGGAHAVAAIYDLQHAAADVCLMPNPDTGDPMGVSHLIPRSREDLLIRHDCLERIAASSAGTLGRSPDYLNVTFAGFAGRADVWAGNGNERAAANLVAFQKEIAARDLALTHTIVHPTVDKSVEDVYAAGGNVALRKVGETEHGILVRGARVLATLAPFSDEIAVYPGHPIPKEAKDYAVAFSIPLATPGLKFLCRDSFSTDSNRFDHPLSGRFDEQDAFVIFDNVEIPRDRVFIDGDPDIYFRVMLAGWDANIMQQTTIRAQTKLEFAYGLGTRIAEALNAKDTVTTELLGELWTYVELTRAALRAAELDAYEWGNGAWFPAPGPLRALRPTLPRWFPRTNEILKLIGGHNLLTTPTEAELANPDLRPLIDHYYQAAQAGAAERTRLFRLAWDFIGSALAGRGELYERFYLASAARNYQLAHRASPKERALALVDRFLKE